MIPILRYKSINHNKYRYQLNGDYRLFCYEELGKEKQIITKYITAYHGFINIRHGYCWDGATGAYNNQSIIRASLIHDAIYQLIREGVIKYHPHKKKGDKLFYDLCIEDGMSKFRALFYFSEEFGSGQILFMTPKLWSA